MGLIRCEQCGYDVSTEATHCPHCNTPIVLFQLKDSLSRKKKGLKTPVRNKESHKGHEKITDDNEAEPQTYKKVTNDTPVRSNESRITQSDTAQTGYKKSLPTSTPLPGKINKTVKITGFSSRFLLILALVILCAGMGIFLYSRPNSPNTSHDNQQEKLKYFSKNRQKIIDEINTQLSLNNYGNAQKIAREYLYINDAEIKKMYVKARKEFLMIELSKLRSEWDNYELPDSLPNDNTKIKLYIDIKQHYREKRRIYDELAKIVPDNKEYAEKYKYFSTRYNEIDTKFEELNKKRAAEQKRQQTIDIQFSGLDGSHINLEKFIKSKMKYPDSYTHIKSAYEDKGEFLIVATTYQGKDIYEQVVIKTVKARVGLNGKVYNIISEY